MNKDTKSGKWWDRTWNPVTGCSAVSEGCERCWAARFAKRLAGRYGYPKGEPFKVTYHRERLEELRHWKKPQRVFVASMSDLFHDEVPIDWHSSIFAAMGACPRHTFLILTKRPKRMRKVFDQFFDCPSNCWLGVTAENQARYDERWPILSEIPAAVKFVSVEPMLGPVRIRMFESRPDWVIAAPETGPGARRCEPEWIDDLAEECGRMKVPFFDKRKTGWIRREFPARTN